MKSGRSHRSTHRNACICLGQTSDAQEIMVLAGRASSILALGFQDREEAFGHDSQSHACFQGNAGWIAEHRGRQHEPCSHGEPGMQQHLASSSTLFRVEREHLLKEVAKQDDLVCRHVVWAFQCLCRSVDEFREWRAVEFRYPQELAVTVEELLSALTLRQEGRRELSEDFHEESKAVVFGCVGTIRCVFTWEGEAMCHELEDLC